MLHSTLSALLVSVASRYAKLSPSDVGIGIGGGRLVIDNVQLRADTFNSPRIPFHVHEGRAGRLRINVPWSALSSTPVKVYLENVHLIAGPKQVQMHERSNPIHKRKHSSDISSTQGEWHQTMVGRLLFNVSVEVYGLKVEYRDDDCVGIISIASLRANSSGPDWNHRFVSLLSDLDPEQPEASAVSMRKLVQLSGVHWVMIPRVKGAPPAAEGLIVNEQGQSPRFSERHLDLKSYESKAPILDGIAVTVRVLMCTGMALVGDSILPGLHAEVDIDLEETNVSLTAQQIKWIDKIVKEGFGVVKKHGVQQNKDRDGPSTKRRPRAFPASPLELQTETVYPSDPVLANGGEHTDEYLSQDGESEPAHESGSNIGADRQESHLPTQSHSAPETNLGRHMDRETTETRDGGHEQDDVVLSESEEEVLLEESTSLDEEGVVGGFHSFWQAIVGEYADETVDDAAVALGLANGYTSADEEELRPSASSEDDADIQYARTAVSAAAAAGGRTFKLRLKTPDLAAWDEVERLREELQKEKDRRQELEDVESVLDKAEDLVKSSQNEIRQLQERNAALVRELEDLERMASQAGRNKDAMIRQTEAALVKAEKNLQALYQTKYEHQIGQLANLRNDPKIDEFLPASIGQVSGKEALALESVDESTEAEEGTEGREVEDQVPDGIPAADGRGDGAVSPQVRVSMDEPAEAQASPTTQSDSRSATLEEVSIADVTPSQRESSIDSERLLMEETATDAYSDDAEQQFQNGPAGIMKSRNIEQAMSSEGLTLV